MSKLADPLKCLVSMFGTVYLIVSEIRQLLAAAKLIQKYLKNTFITVLIFKDNSLYFASFCRPIAFAEFCKFVVYCVCCFLFYFEAYPKIFVSCCADEKYSVPANKYQPTLNLRYFAELLGLIRYIAYYIYMLLSLRRN